MAKEFSTWLSETYQVHIESDKIQLGLLSGFEWDHVLLLDSDADTLLFIEEVKVKPTNFRFNHIHKIYVEGLQLNYVYKDSIQNSPLYQKCKPFFEKQTSSLNQIKIDHLWLNGAQINFGETHDVKKFKELDMYLKDGVFGAENSFEISNLEWQMHRGAEHKLSSSKIYLSSEKNKIQNFHWQSSDAKLLFDLEQDKTKQLTQLSKLDFVLNQKACVGLISNFPTELEFHIQSQITIDKERLWTENLKIDTKHNSQFRGELLMDNLHKVEQTGYQVNVDTLSVFEEEWVWVEPLFNRAYLLEKLGDIQASGIVEGTVQALNLDIELQSSQGYVSSDVFVNVSDTLRNPIYTGDVILEDFNLDTFISNKGLGNISAEVHVDGEGLDLSSFDTHIFGEIAAIEIQEYSYNSINLNGRLKPNYFTGEAEILDENLELIFSGEVDFSGQKPVMDFVADIVEANLVALKWYTKESVAKLSSLVEINLVGDNWDNIEGDIGVYYTTVETYDNYYHFNDVNFYAKKSSEQDSLIIQSDFANANLIGQVNMPNLYSSFISYLSPHLPLLAAGQVKAQDFKFDLALNNTTPITNLLLPQLVIGDGTQISGSFNSKTSGLDIVVNCPNITWEEWLFRDLELNSKASEEHWELGLKTAKIDRANETKFESVELDQIGSFGDWRYALACAATDTTKFDGILKGEVKVDKKSMEMAFDESQFYFSDTLWTLNSNSKLNYNHKQWNSQLRLETQSQQVNFSSTDQQISCSFKDVEFTNFRPWLVKSRTDIDARLNGYINLTRELQTYAELSIDNLYLNNSLFGDIDINVDYDEQDETQKLEGSVFVGEEKTIDLRGVYMPKVDSNNFNLDLDVVHLDLAPIGGYLDNVFEEFGGEMNGSMRFYGDIIQAEFEGEFNVDRMNFSVPYLNTSFVSVMPSKLYLSDRYIDFKDVVFTSIEKEDSIGKAVLNGELLHHHFKDFELGLDLQADSFLCLNTEAYKDEPYYGRAVATGDISFKGPVNAIDILVNAKSEGGTSIFIPLDDDEQIDELSFIHFIEKEQKSTDSLWTLSEVIGSQGGLSVDLNLEFDRKAEVNLIFDETLGDKINARGNGFINLGVNSADDIYMYGDYTLEEGDYLFTLQNFANKKFEIEKGATLSWDGNPYKADMNLSALYKLNTNISPLSSEYNRNADVECSMLMTGDLLRPNIEFDIQIPKGDDLIKRILDERTNTEEKNTQQFLSLLVLNSFMSTDELENTDVDYLSSTVSTGTEVLSNQLSNWMSQFTDRVDLGVRYHPNLGDTLSNKEFEVLLNNMKVNDRITFNGNIGMLPTQNTTRVIGDFKVEYELSDDGKLRLLAFRNLEESFQLQDDVSNYTTGLGLFYRDEFDDFSDLWNNFLKMFRRKRLK